MKKLLVIAIPLLIVFMGSHVLAQNGAGKHVSVAAKGQSDGQMQLALGQLQSAAASVKLGTAAPAIGSLQTAALHLKQALPIYHGLREKSLADVKQAISVLTKNGPHALQRASVLIGKATTLAKNALKVN